MLSQFRPVIENRNFRLLWSSQVLSLLTIHIMNFVLLTRLFERTGSSLATALLWISYALPAILFGPLAAAIVDLRDRKEILIIANLVQSLTIFLFALSHRSTFYFLYGVVFIYSFVNQFYVPAESASLPSLVSKALYTQANSLFFMTQQAALMLGFSLGGVVLHFLGFERALFLCASLVFVAFICVLFLPKIISSHEKADRSAQDQLSLFQRIGHGYSFIRENRRVLAPLLVLLAFQAALAIIIVNIPAVATDLLHIAAPLAGIYIIVPAAGGAILGAAILPHLIAAGWRKKRIVEIGLLLSAVLILAHVFGVSAIRSALRIYAGFLLNIIVGLSFVAITVPSQTMLQEATPKEMRGRVFGNYSFLGNVTAVLPVIFSGTIAHFFGVKPLFTLLAALSLAAVVFSHKRGDRFMSPIRP
jgi:MFS family permease